MKNVLAEKYPFEWASYFFKAALIVMFLLCLANMPYVYYVIVRTVAMIAFGGLFLHHIGIRRHESEALVYGGLALLFQPIYPIHLGRFLWNVVDVIVAGGLIWSIGAQIKEVKSNRRGEFKKRYVDRTAAKSIGTILTLDLNAFLDQTPGDVSNINHEDGKINTMFIYALKEKPFNKFNILKISVAGANRRFDLENPTTIILHTPNTKFDREEVESILNPILGLYGSDSDGKDWIHWTEVEQSEKSNTWQGRKWHFDYDHNLLKSYQNMDDCCYSVYLIKRRPEQGLSLAVKNYNNMIRRFYF